MNTVRMVLAVALAAGVCYAAAGALRLTVTDFGAGIAVAAACWCGLDLCGYVERRRDDVRLARERVWLRRDREAGC